MFKPTYTQAVTKAKVLQYVADGKGLYSLESLPLDQLVRATGQRRLGDWLKDPEFVSWFYDKDSFKTSVLALQDLAVERLLEVLERPVGDPRDGGITPKEVLGAADLLAKLTGAYPSKAKVVFADKDLENLDEAEVKARIAAARAALDA